MLKIKALNQESSSDEDIPTIRREAQEEIVLELYNNALRAQARKEYADSQNILKQLIEENIPQLENNGGLPKSMSTLKYSCYVNLGNIYLNENNIIKALESFTNASELDSTDVTLWAKIGKLALKEDKFSKAAYAFSKGLECSESHWPCLDNLISVLYAIKDTVSCLVYIGKALMLDADYIKGLVLRKQIYTDNPATREYYKLYNPDHIWEPPLDIEIDQEEEEDILKEAQSLSKRLSEVEKVLGPKPFEIIPLPKALGECTWVALSKTVICCHKYITNNEMSHFTRFDMSKCMSQSTETEPIQSNKIVEDINIINDNKSSDNKCLESIIEVTSSVEKMETSASLVERRTSQNSEPTNGNDNPENITPIQTDNDDEQNMELENDNETDGDNQGDNIDTTNQRRKGKRKRDVLSDLQIWGWHSKRKQSKKASKDYTVQDALNRIIPKTLLKNKITVEIINQDDEDSMNTMDIYNMYVENKELNFLSPIHSPKSVNFEAYFGTDREKDDVSNFWTKERPRTDAIILVKELTIELSKLWQYKWPKELVFLYIEVFKMYREHCDQPQVFCTELTFEEISADALATLLYGELISFSSETAESIHPCILSYLQIVSNWSESGKEEFSSFFVRFYWLQSHCFRKTDENELAIKALEAILGEIDEKENKLTDRFSLSLPNCFKYGFITKQIIDKILKHLSMIISLGSIENLFNSQKYTEVAEILKQTFYSGSYPKVGRMGRPAQLGILMHSLWFTNWEECFVWTEECLNESLQNYWKPSADQDKWIKIMEKCLGIFLEIIKKETVSIIDKLSEEKRCRLVEGCAKIVCKQLNTENDACKALGCITPWLLLHYILLRDEHRQYASKRLSQSKKDQVEIQEDTPEPNEEELPPSIAILSSAHEFLGPKGWCLAGNGELLHFILDTSLDRLDTPIFEPFRDKIDIHIEQAMFCLYLYPSKKNKISRHLIDHNVNPLPLTWERSFQLYQYYAPDSLPEFNSYKNASISSDLEQLFKRIIGLVPSICALHDHLPRIMDFIHGKCDKLPEPVDFPNRVRAIYYLIGDYYFKEKEFARCIKYFQLDLCVNPTRLDSWASLALSYAAQLENTLNYCEKLKNDTDFFDKAKSAQICFKKALELDADNLVLWIECGSFEYMVHSFCSRLIKFESESFSMEKFELLESEKENYLDSSGNSLERAIALYEIDDSNEPDERWLQYYILGKIAEKKRKEPTEYLQYYLTASTLLHENKATYPEKINYNNPQHLSVEALELHYRIHASVLKYLEMHEGKEILNTLGSFFKKCLNSTAKHFGTPPPPAVQVPKPAESSTSATTNQSFQDQFLNSIKNFKDIKDVSEYADDSKDIVEKCLEDILSKVDEIIKENDLNKVILKVNDSEKIVGRAKKHSSQEKDEDLDVTIIEEDEVIMIISDSEDETSTILDQKTKTNAEVSPDTIEKNNEIEMGVDVTEHVEDVQSLLDKMMEQTMKDTEKMDDSDANNSSTEHIEEVVIKEDSLDTPDGELPEIKTNERSAETKVDKIAEPSKTKPSDSETDTENRKIADDDSSSSSSSSSSDSSSSDSDSDDSDSSSSSSSSDTSNENMSNSEILQLVDKCVQGLEICITRLPQNYKALYRLAHFLFNYKSRKDYTKCKQLLLGEYKCKDSTVITGLFSDRKTTNFFNGIWRIPSTEIDRPGSLAAHMNRCISLVLQVLRNTNDTKTLMELCMQLLKVPDRDKIYIKDSDRKAFSEQALSMCIQSFKSQIKNVLNMQNQQIVKLLHDIFRIFQRVQKHIPSKESTFSGLLTDVYRQFIKENIPDSVNVLDLAIKFCQQHRPIEKHKTSVLNPVFSRSPGVAKSPVHPTPSTFVGSQKPLKPPSLGRPRGRPPLPKLPGHVRHPRPKGSSSSSIGSYPWQNPMFGGTNFSYEYLKHYQDELIKQYSQNLSISQLNQLTQFFSAGQLNNPAVAQASQFLTQANLLNSTSGMLRPPMSNIGTSSLLDPNVAFKGFNPQLSPALANLTPDQMKFLESMLPNMSKQTSTTKLSSSGTKSSGNQYAGACKTYSSSSSKSASNSKTLVSSSKTINLDVQKLKPSTTGKPPAPVFKEPVQAKVYPSLNTSDDKAANILMKDRPNISITPVGGLSVTPVTTSHLVSKSGYSTPVTNTNITFSKTSLPKPHTTNPNISKHIPSLSTGHPLSKPSFVQTITSSNTILSKPTSLSMHHTSSSPTFSKPSHLSISHSSPSTSKHAPVAHSSTSPKPAHTLPSTPPPVSSPSFIKPGISTSPGKTLQEKLADKKKEQETKQLMKNIEAEIFSANIPSTSAALLKGLNLPNIPSSLSVSPSSTNNAISVYPANMSLELEKQQNLQKFPSAKNTGHMTGHSIERQLPSSLTVSKSVPPSVYTPRFSPDSGISISPVSPTTIKDKHKPTEKHLTLHDVGTFMPISLDQSMDISPISSKGSSNSPISPKGQTKQSSPHTVIQGLKMSNLSSKSKSKDSMSVKKDLFSKPSCSGMEISNAKSTIVDTVGSRQDFVVKKNASKFKQDGFKKGVVKPTTSDKNISKHVSSDKKALSVIKHLTSIDISPVPLTYKKTNELASKEEVICLDSDGE